MKRISVRKIAFAGVVAALYAGLTIIGLSYGPVQLRVSEVLCILPFFFPFSVPGLVVGCFAANLLGFYGIVDAVVGSFASLLAALSTMWISRLGRERLVVKAFACFPPVIFNALIIGAMIAFLTLGTEEEVSFLFAFSFVGLGQFVVMYALGLPLMIYLPKTKLIDKLATLYDRGEEQ